MSRAYVGGRYSGLRRKLADIDRRIDTAEQNKGRREVPSFGDWLPIVSPEMQWNWPHLLYLRAQLDRLTRGEIDRLAVFMPPQHGKTSIVTVRYPVWRLERTPSMRVILGAYNQKRSEKMSRQSRQIARRRVAISRERNAAMQWETPQGGGFRACGVGSPPTGEGGELLLVDDPIKTRMEADSEAYRDRVWDWYAEELITRLQKGGQAILVLTRWHQDDLAGRILASEDGPSWTVVSLPALAEENDLLGREVGQALCPERFDEVELLRRKRIMGWAFQPLYQQRTTAKEGGLFKRHYFQHTVSALPVGAKLVRYWDKAGTAGGGCFTAGFLMAKCREGYYYLVNVTRAQLAATEREGLIKAVAITDTSTHGRVTIGVEQEPGSSGKESAEATVKGLAGYTVKIDRVTGSKEVRAEPLATQCDVGNVRIVRTGDREKDAWIAPFIEEACSFPRGRFKDQIDAGSGAFHLLSGTLGKGEWGMEKL